MLYSAFKIADRIFKFKRAKAHCDIPCGIYDPITAQISCLTIIRMIDLMTELEKNAHERDLDYHNTMVRYIQIKEEHAERCKHEIRIIWGDYFKPEHFEEHPVLVRAVPQIMKLASEAKQSPDRERALELLKSVNLFAEAFWETKGISTKRSKAPYKPEEEVVYPAL